jgi:hypothetical protein
MIGVPSPKVGHANHAPWLLSPGALVARSGCFRVRDPAGLVKPAVFSKEVPHETVG